MPLLSGGVQHHYSHSQPQPQLLSGPETAQTGGGGFRPIFVVDPLYCAANLSPELGTSSPSSNYSFMESRTDFEAILVIPRKDPAHVSTERGHPPTSYEEVNDLIGEPPSYDSLFQKKREDENKDSSISCHFLAISRRFRSCFYYLCWTTNHYFCHWTMQDFQEMLSSCILYYKQ